METIIRSEPTGKFSRRLWFLYEWLMDRCLDLPDTKVSNFVDALDTKLQYSGPATASRRHRVRNNLPGVRDFCPLIRRTETLETFTASRWHEKVKESLGRVRPGVLTRAAAFLLLKDSKASYAIEGERVPHNRAERWGRAIGQAGQQNLTMAEILRLQEIVIEDRRFTTMGWRRDEGVELLIGFLRQGQGTLSHRARNRDFKALTNDEVTLLEDRYADIFSL